VSAPETQKRRPNPFYPAFDLLLAKLLAAEQALRVSETLFENALESPDEWLSQIPEGELPGMLADICDLGIPGYVKNIPSFRWPDREKDYLLRAVSDFRTQSCLWCIARAFEDFREFAGAVERSITHDGAPCPSHLDTWVARLLPKRKKEPDRRFSAVLKRIRDSAPSLVTCERGNARKIQLQQWICMAAAVRHAVAHSEGILKQTDYKTYGSSGLEEHFPGELEEGTGYVLKPTLDSTAKTIRTFREYGVAIYKTVSEAQGFSPVLVGPDGEITTWRR